MATLIPALGSCTARMTSGERRLAERLEHKLEDDYLLWFDVPIGPKQTHPDFVVLRPRRGAPNAIQWQRAQPRRCSYMEFDALLAEQRCAYAKCSRNIEVIPCNSHTEICLKHKQLGFSRPSQCAVAANGRQHPLSSTRR